MQDIDAIIDAATYAGTNAVIGSHYAVQSVTLAVLSGTTATSCQRFLLPVGTCDLIMSNSWP